MNKRYKHSIKNNKTYPTDDVFVKHKYWLAFQSAIWLTANSQ